MQKLILFRSLIVLIVLLFISSPVSSIPKHLESVSDLSSLGVQIRAEKRPLLLLFSATHCEYCERLTEEQLIPLTLDNSYRNKLFLKELKIDKAGYIRNFDGEKISYEAFADLYDIDVTPTLVLVDHRGRQLAKRMIGYGNPDFFSAYMDDRIQVAINKLNTILK